MYTDHLIDGVKPLKLLDMMAPKRFKPSGLYNGGAENVGTDSTACVNACVNARKCAPALCASSRKQ